MTTSILLQHLGGSKANQNQQFPLEDLEEITLGRDPASKVAFDPLRDDTVSRHHAVIKVQQGDPPTFTITDLGSSNGTLINGNRISGQHELAVGDTIELGAKGPKFIFDLQPRPPGLMGRTRVIDITAPGATRVLKTADTVRPTTVAVDRPTGENAKLPIGRETVERLIYAQRQETDDLLLAQRRATNRSWQYIAGAILLVLFIGGGGLYYVSHRAAATLETAKADIQAGFSTSIAQANADVSQRIGLSSAEITQKFRSATVLILAQWRAYDSFTGKPLFHRVNTTSDGVKRPCFVELPDHSVVPWLTTDEEADTNYPIGGGTLASGFVIDQQGYIATNKHVAAGWMRPFELTQGSGEVDLYQIQNAGGKAQTPKRVRTDDPRISKIADKWVPDGDGIVFLSKQPIPAGPMSRPLFGRDDTLEVRFPGNRASTSGRFVRAAPDADVALIKVDTQQVLSWAALAEGDEVKVGQRVVVLGYPGFTQPTLALVQTTETGQKPFSIDLIPDPTVTDGIISHIGQGRAMKANDPANASIPVYSGDGDLYQLTVPTGPGNSGGPVFNSAGKVIGIFVYSNLRHETVTYASPIRYAQMLKNVQ